MKQKEKIKLRRSWHGEEQVMKNSCKDGKADRAKEHTRGKNALKVPLKNTHFSKWTCAFTNNISWWWSSDCPWCSSKWKKSQAVTNKGPPIPVQDNLILSATHHGQKAARQTKRYKPLQHTQLGYCRAWYRLLCLQGIAWNFLTTSLPQDILLAALLPAFIYLSVARRLQAAQILEQTCWLKILALGVITQFSLQIPAAVNVDLYHRLHLS